MDAELTIRIARHADCDALVRLAAAFRDLLQQTTPSEAEFRTSIALLLKDQGAEFLLACDRRGNAVGYVQLRYRYSAWTSAIEAEIEDVFVTSKARRRRIGRQLVEFAITRATQKGCRRMGLNTNQRNTAALALYQQLGFVAERALWNGGRQLWLEKALT